MEKTLRNKGDYCKCDPVYRNLEISRKYTKVARAPLKEWPREIWISYMEKRCRTTGCSFTENRLFQNSGVKVSLSLNAVVATPMKCFKITRFHDLIVRNVLFFSLFHIQELQLRNFGKGILASEIINYPQFI